MSVQHLPLSASSACRPKTIPRRIVERCGWISEFLKELLDSDPELALALGVITTLTEVIKRSKETTMMGLRHELEEATQYLEYSLGSENMAVRSGADIFLCFVTRTSLEIPDLRACKMRLVQRGEQLKAQKMTARMSIALYSDSFFRDGMTVLTHGYSRVVFSIIDRAIAKGKRISVIQSETRPLNSGNKMAERLSHFDVPVTMIPDSAVAHVINEVDLVIVGAEALAENGGIVSAVGTYQVAIVAHVMNKPFYVATESFKFTRIYPLNQHEISNRYADCSIVSMATCPQSLRVYSPVFDFTPPKYITLLFTDLGILTPSAVSDELIKLYY